MILKELLALNETKTNAPKTITAALKAVLVWPAHTPGTPGEPMLDWNISDKEDRLNVYTRRDTKSLMAKLNKALAPFDKHVVFNSRESGFVNFNIEDDTKTD